MNAFFLLLTKINSFISTTISVWVGEWFNTTVHEQVRGGSEVQYVCD